VVGRLKKCGRSGTLAGPAEILPGVEQLYGLREYWSAMVGLAWLMYRTDAAYSFHSCTS
jgi:hypothetical protein